MPPSVITGGLAVALMFSLTHSAARLEDSAAPVLSCEARHPSDELLDLVVSLLTGGGATAHGWIEEDVRLIKLPEGVYHWTATHPEWEGPVSAYAIDDGTRLILIDPIAVPDDVRAQFGSREVVTVLTNTWHERDAAVLGFPVWAPAPDRPEDQLVPATRYAIGDSLFGLEAYPGREGQLDLVLWSERIRAVITGDTLVDLRNGLEIPAGWLPEGVTVDQVATGLRPLLDKPVEFVLPTHGEPADRAALERALA